MRGERLSPAADNNYWIKRNYTAREVPEYYVDQRKGGEQVVWQPEVYGLTATLAAKLGLGHVIDLGCGNGEKLAALHPGLDIVGVDFGENLVACREKYGVGDWFEADFEKGIDPEVSDDVLEDSVLVNSDVIEHLIDPVPLVQIIGRLLGRAKVAVLSTPERNLERGFLDLGPPKNRCHTREWTLSELGRFLKAEGLEVVHGGLTRTNTEEPDSRTILFVLTKGHQPDVAEAVRGEVEPFAKADYVWRAAKRTAKIGLGRL